MVFLEKNSGFFLHERNNLVIFEFVMTTIVNRVRFIVLYYIYCGEQEEQVKIDDALRVKLVKAVERAGGAKEFSRQCGINAANISRYLRGVISSIKDDNWEKLAPFLENDASGGHAFSRSSDVIRSTPELTEFITAKMKIVKIRNIEQLRVRMNFSSYELLRCQMAGKINWCADTIARVFEVLEIDTADSPVSGYEQRLIEHAAMKRQGTGVMRMLPVIRNLESGTPVIDGEVPVPLDDTRDLRAFRMSGDQMKPLLSVGDIGIFEVINPADMVPESPVAAVRYIDCISGDERLVFRRFHRASGGLAVLSCDNTEFPCIIINESNISWCAIIRRRITEF